MENVSKHKVNMAAILGKKQASKQLIISIITESYNTPPCGGPYPALSCWRLGQVQTTSYKLRTESKLNLRTGTERELRA